MESQTEELGSCRHGLKLRPAGETQLRVELQILFDHLEFVMLEAGEGMLRFTSYRVAVAVLSQDGVQLRLHRQGLLLSPGCPRRAKNSGERKQSESEGDQHTVFRTLSSLPILYCSYVSQRSLSP